MPLTRCQSNKRPGWKWGTEGACYVYTPGNKASEALAKAKALKQGQAVKASQVRARTGSSKG